MCSIDIEQAGRVYHVLVTLDGPSSEDFIIHIWPDGQDDKPWYRLQRQTSTELSYTFLPQGGRNGKRYHFHVYMLQKSGKPLFVGETSERIY